MQELNIISDGKRTCVRALEHQNEHLRWLREKGYPEESQWVIQAKETIEFWVYMLSEWESME